MQNGTIYIYIEGERERERDIYIYVDVLITWHCLRHIVNRQQSFVLSAWHIQELSDRRPWYQAKDLVRSAAPWLRVAPTYTGGEISAYMYSMR